MNIILKQYFRHNRRSIFGGIIENFKTKHYNSDFHLPGDKKLDLQGVHDNHKLSLSNKRGIQLFFERESIYYKHNLIVLDKVISKIID